MGLYLFVCAVYGHVAEDTGLEPIPTESGHRSEIRTHNLTTRRGKSFPLAYSMKVCCATITPILNIKLGAYTFVRKPDSNRRLLSC